MVDDLIVVSVIVEVDEVVTKRVVVVVSSPPSRQPGNRKIMMHEIISIDCLIIFCCVFDLTQRDTTVSGRDYPVLKEFKLFLVYNLCDSTYD